MKKQIISSFPFLPLTIEYNFVPQFISPEQSLKKQDDKHLFWSVLLLFSFCKDLPRMMQGFEEQW